MKKKFLYGLLFTVLCFMTFVTVHAAASDYKLTEPAKAMTFEINNGKTVYAVLDDVTFKEFHDKVQFSAKTGTDKITPSAALQKILVTQSPEKSTSIDLTKPASQSAGENWFTGYCLDAGLKYPAFSIYNMDMAAVAKLLQATHESTYVVINPQTQEVVPGAASKYDRQVGAVALLAMLNNAKFKDLFSQYVGYNQQMDIEYSVKGLTGTLLEDAQFSTADLYYDNEEWAVPVGALKDVGTEGKKTTDFLNMSAVQMSRLFGGADATVYVKSITVHSASEAKTIEADKFLAKDSSGSEVEGYFKTTFTAENILYDNYTVDTSKDKLKNYRHSLWIIEHSFPSMTIDDFLVAVNPNFKKADLEAQILGLYPGVEFSDAQKENLIDNYVYWTVQFAMWRANDSFEKDGNRLGTELYLGDLGTNNMLNEIYNYLIKPRDEYTTYGEGEYTNKIIVNKDNNDKYTESGDYLTYGPYTAKYEVIDPSAITVEVTSNNKSDVKIVDKDGKELTAVTNGQEFYVRCKKSAKVTSVSLKFSANGRTYDEDGKGAIYYANFAMNQNVISGLKYKNVNAEATETLTYNPKTGVPNIAIVFVITLIAFALGYLALSYNNKSMELN